MALVLAWWKTPGLLPPVALFALIGGLLLALSLEALLWKLELPRGLRYYFYNACGREEKAPSALWLRLPEAVAHFNSRMGEETNEALAD